jgi:uncharacterized membrane protein
MEKAMSASMPTPMMVHLFAALAALLLGAWQLLAARRGARHRMVGYLWLLAMLVTSLSSFRLESGLGIAWLAGFSPIHALSVFTMISLAMALFHARARDFRRHQRWIAGAYAGLVAAGVVAAALPGRALHAMLFVELPRIVVAAAAQQF